MKKILYFLLFVLLISNAYSDEPKFRSGIFLHHSTGERIWGPNSSTTSVPDEITNYNNSHSYTGDNSCSMTEEWWPNNPGDNEWVTWHRIFNYDISYDNIRPYFPDNRIIMIKSCFPSSNMTGWGSYTDTTSCSWCKSVYNYKWHWRNFLREMRRHPHNFFVIWTNAPLVSDATTDDEAYFSHHFCLWAKDTLAEGLDPEFGAFPENVYVFDFFHKLVDAQYKLPAQYAQGDSHPNAAATELVAPQLVNEVFDAAILYEQYFYSDICPASHTVSGVVASGYSEKFRASSQIYAAGNSNSLIIQANASATFYAGNRIVLLSGFHSYQNSRMITKLDANPCFINAKIPFLEELYEKSSNKVILFDNKEEITIYPNPNSGIFNVRLNNNPTNKISLEIINLYGETVFESRVIKHSLIKIDISGQAKGLYFLMIKQEDKILIGKIIYQ